MKRKIVKIVISFICMFLTITPLWSVSNELVSELYKGNINFIKSAVFVKERKAFSYLLNDIFTVINTDPDELWEWLLTSNSETLLENVNQSDLGYLPTIYLHVASAYGQIPSAPNWNQINYAKNVFYTNKLDNILYFLKDNLIKGIELIPAKENITISFANRNMKSVVYYGFNYGLYSFICVDTQAVTLNYELINNVVNVNKDKSITPNTIYKLLNESELFELRFSEPIKLFLDRKTNELMVSIPEMILYMKKVGPIARFSTKGANGIDHPMNMKLTI